MKLVLGVFFLACGCEFLATVMKSLSKIHPLIVNLCTAFTSSCSVITGLIINTHFIWDTGVKEHFFLVQVEKYPVINTCIICFSNFPEWLSWPFDVSSSWYPASPLGRWEN